MLRIHFGADDIARVRLAPGPVPAVELACRIRDARRAAGRRVAAATRLNGLGPASARTACQPPSRLLLDLWTPTFWPSFLMPIDPSLDRAGYLEAVTATPTAALREGVRALSLHARPGAWTRELATGDRATRLALRAALARYWDVAMAPHWEEVQQRSVQARAARAAAMAVGGVSALFDSLHPRLRWRAPVLELHWQAPAALEVHLRGRGLLLVPSVAAGDVPVTNLDEDPEVPTIVYPVGPSRPAGEPARGADPLARLTPLLGRTRARVLVAITTTPGCTTTQLARQLRISLAAASQHASVLREAGAVRTTRKRNYVHHSPTALGIELVGAGCGSHSAEVISLVDRGSRARAVES